ncbi:NAD(P)H dehydrogenase (quinone) [Jannaschia pagri]|uniref:NAD(P)H dehydrogenase (Quinone) n=1 Tax=Jannaschia pagri TaxID=2829797 RepID=A0ABQ4NMD0_9RHOB|nr:MULTISPECIES: NAD(P)H-dependent oxidoreductase [unclassified Jannaschia]GIT91687.1 NAD(P)H dehydrogenase (quinone) [Jannaschia sp. AI_61]GIT95521.1 NAD(P)H dehydrogenase (quinone) [Jannaschia sp. AI_62]
MRALVIFCHPKEDSFTAGILSLVKEKLDKAGAEYRVRDLYRSNFSPVLTAHELDIYLDESLNQEPVAQDVADVKWADTLIFVYPTWWYGLPAMLKGWLDRVLVPGVAFIMPRDGENIRPGLTNITRLGVFTTCGASRWLTTFIGAPGRRTLTRGVRAICAKRCKTVFAAHYLMDSSTDSTRGTHLSNVATKMDRLLA